MQRIESQPELVAPSAGPGKLSCAVGIATYNRHEILLEAVRCLMSQTRHPDEILVADSSPDCASSSQRIQDEFPELSTITKYKHFPAPRGLTLQRNVILDCTTCDVILFIDDDALAAPTYVENVMKVYEADTAELIGGIEGIALEGAAIESPPLSGESSSVPRQPWHHAVRKLPKQLGRRIDRFLNKHWLGPYFPSEFTRPLHEIPATLQAFPVESVRSLYGCVMSFRTKVARKYRANEHLKLYAFLEDFELSYRIGNEYGLLRCHGAEARHLRIQGGRLHPSIVTYLGVLNLAYIARTAMKWEPRLRRHLNAHLRRWQMVELTASFVSKERRRKYRAIKAARKECEAIYTANDERVDAEYDRAAERVHDDRPF